MNKKILLFLWLGLVILVGCEKKVERDDVEKQQSVEVQDSNSVGEEKEEFLIMEELINSSIESGVVQIGDALYYIGEPLSNWTDKGLSILPNTTAYEDCIILGIENTPICRLYIAETDSVMIEDSLVDSIYFGILRDASITQSNA